MTMQVYLFEQVINMIEELSLEDIENLLMPVLESERETYTLFQYEVIHYALWMRRRDTYAGK
jgi:hypothetical protein